MSAEEDADGSRIYVGNLIPKANEMHLKKIFARFGVIHNIWIARKPPGFAFVNYESAEGAMRAVEGFELAKDSDHAMEILGKPVKVQMAGEKDKKKADGKEKSVRIVRSNNGGGGVRKQRVKDTKRGDALQHAERDKNSGQQPRERCLKRLKRSRSPTRNSRDSCDDAQRQPEAEEVEAEVRVVAAAEVGTSSNATAPETDGRDRSRATGRHGTTVAKAPTGAGLKIADAEHLEKVRVGVEKDRVSAPGEGACTHDLYRRPGDRRLAAEIAQQYEWKVVLRFVCWNAKNAVAVSAQWQLVIRHGTVNFGLVPAPTDFIKLWQHFNLLFDSCCGICLETRPPS